MYTPEHYDRHDQLKPGLWLTLVMAFTARTWLLFVASVAAREQGSALLSLVYPDPMDFYLGLALGMPALALGWAWGYRHKLQGAKGFWSQGRGLLGFSLMAQLGLALQHPTPLPVEIVCSGWALWYLYQSRHCKAVFHPDTDPLRPQA